MILHRTIIASLVASMILFCVVSASTTCSAADTKTIRVGVIGVDGPHPFMFSQHMNDPKATDARVGVTVVAAYVGGSDDVPSSVKYRKEYVKKVQDLGIEIVPTIEALLTKVDAVMIESLDGRIHRSEAKKVIAAGKPLFIDKPLAGSLADCVEIAQAAKRAGVPWFSASSLRYSEGVAAIGDGKNDKVGKIRGCDAWGPNHPLEPHSMPDLFYYGIHGTEILFTIMGPGCKTVARAHSDDGGLPDGTDVVVGVWDDGRIGTYRSASGFGATVFGSKGVVPSGGWSGYEPLVVVIAEFFKTGKAPISPEEILEVYAFLAAADVSKSKGGCPVSIEAVLNEDAKKTGVNSAK
ncbi:MAG: Gfo/Idh/MocA family oxidoreductase [Pirellulales bacterium]|nr:Gfo/Idh/MocA family oxidoreductase [Pirellulales bacterium]